MSGREVRRKGDLKDLGTVSELHRLRIGRGYRGVLGFQYRDFLPGALSARHSSRMRLHKEFQPYLSLRDGFFHCIYLYVRIWTLVSLQATSSQVEVAWHL